jgi:steroid delta-isomerase-like uncharacterized protein
MERQSAADRLRKDEHPRSEEEARNKTVARRFFEEVWNKGNLAVANAIVTADQVTHDPNTPNTAPGPEGAKQVASFYRGAFPDLHFQLEDVIADGDKVVVRITATGTHQRELPGIPVTGKRIAVHGIVIQRFEDGKIVESWVQFDHLGLLQQLGAVPTAWSAAATG